MVRAKNYDYETASTFVEVIQRKLLASFFGHRVYYGRCAYRQNVTKLSCFERRCCL